MKLGDHIWVRLHQYQTTRYRGLILEITSARGKKLDTVARRCVLRACVEHHANEYRILQIGPGGNARGFDEIEPRTTNV